MELQQDLQALADELDDTVGQASVRWLSAKPLFDYLLARYDVDPRGASLGGRGHIESSQWESLTSWLDGAPAVLLWAETPLAATRDRLVAEGVQCIVLDTTASPPQEGDFVSVMRGNINAIDSALAFLPASGKPAD